MQGYVIIIINEVASSLAKEKPYIRSLQRWLNIVQVKVAEEKFVLWPIKLKISLIKVEKKTFIMLFELDSSTFPAKVMSREIYLKNRLST